MVNEVVWMLDGCWKCEEGRRGKEVVVVVGEEKLVVMVVKMFK